MKLYETIEGYSADMTAEEKLALLENIDAPDPASTEPTISKKRFDEVSSELSKAKKALRARMTEEEAKADEQKQRETEMLEELETLRKKEALSNHTNRFLGVGMTAETAAEAASALYDGDYDGVFALMGKHMEASKKAMQAELLKNTPTPPPSENEDLKEKKRIAELRKNFGLPD